MKSTAVLLLLTMAASTKSTVTSTDRQAEGLLGPVKSLELQLSNTSINQSESPREEERVLSRTLLFDVAGNKTGEVIYGKGVILLRRVFSYDSRNNKTGESQYDRRNALLSRTTLTFNSKGVKTSEIYYKADNSIAGKWLYAYDASDRMVRTTFINQFGEEVAKRIVTYDAKGGRIEVSEGYPFPASIHKQISTYDSKGHITVVESYTGDGVFQGKTESDYDANGRLIEEVWYDAKGLSSRSVFSFDDKNNLVGRLDYGADGLVRASLVNRYEFDSRGNWVKKVSIKEGQNSGKSDAGPVEIAYRRVTYY